jgi:hypothetical protein
MLPVEARRRTADVRRATEGSAATRWTEGAAEAQRRLVPTIQSGEIVAVEDLADTGVVEDG